MILAYLLTLLSLTIYSFSLVDPNITFFQSKWWEVFREKMVYLGYYQRQTSWMLYFFLVVFLFIFHYFFVKKYKKFNPVKLALLIGIILLISYPLLSHDFFNYMFDARIMTFYHQNPYLFKAQDFPSDAWLRFMQWTHRTYPYGLSFLPITLIPSFLSLGKFFLSFLFFKSIFIIFYFLAVFFLNKISKEYAIIFATHPLIIIEGLVNSHNDLIAVSFGIIGIYFLFRPIHNSGSQFIARLFFTFSLGIKYITLPIVFLTNTNVKRNTIIFTVLLGVILYLSMKSEIQAWYFLNLFIFIPFFVQSINRLNIFFFGLLTSYYPYIRLGGWDSFEKVDTKHWIIVFAAILNLLYLLIPYKKIIFKHKNKDPN
ncbi:hypothetical protein A2767_06790 [Candidatus Roizmanbacteria bacterium RIFCSPHIGHO2_01_FULL_35_10]|uniref:DUF2029 domain-containing protein n=1 Tax=Candidatus Roizmanbacteria bacterium RIFCSPLOWO2_01_FULL_35_13 TaxID=1802055 RepID=A0A1F7I7J0_9BACT|nr:MAG: hypothetical protein A2767_06790 [Candidatus Roizmanbacteria bacterium RIFCSPHIGHO2_01_FULL_35_10]OGK39339.1 MAG: hypothetical protein A3A74_05210 [Candidatus Roizmanbacteria bacterium RIFCSPLOWO2_01_FULL_35_13]